MTGAGNQDLVVELAVAAQVHMSMTGAGNRDLVVELAVAAQVDVP